MIEEYMEEARMVAAQCWCDEETRHKEMDVMLAESVARRIAAWMADAAQSSRNADFYRGLLIKCAEYLGADVYSAIISDSKGILLQWAAAPRESRA